MKDVRKHEKNQQMVRKTLIVTAIAFLLVVVVGVAVFLHFYSSYIDGVLYRERLNQMQEVTTQLFDGLEDVVMWRWSDVDSYCNYIATEKPQDSASVLSFLQKHAMLNNLVSKGESLVAVDNLGRYLTEEGWQGMLEEMDLLLEAPERVNFVSKSLTSGETRMFFLKALSEPIVIQDGERNVQILYFGISQDMKQLNAYFGCEAYDNSNSVYVLDHQGMKLFRSSARSLVEGYNAYAVLRRMEYLHGHSFEDAWAELSNSGHGYANAILDGEEYYYALYQMDYAEWTLLFLVPSAYVATNVVSMVNMTVRLILTFAIFLVTLSAALIFVIFYTQQRKAVNAERQNSERLAEALSAAESAEQAANEANRAKSEFLSNMSHDIRTPMNAIVGLTKLMAHDKADPGKIGSYVGKMEQSSHYLMGLINDILDMSKIESGEVTFNMETISLAEQIGQIESIVCPQMEERRQNFVIYTHNLTYEYLVCDPVRLRQIVVNLLSNANKYTEVGGNIRLDLEERTASLSDRTTLCISVTDNGCGMTQEFIGHIFEPFVRAKNSTINKTQGSGLGMAITKRIVDLMGGTISVRSEVGKGSCFTVELPLLVDRETKWELPVRKVLLVSDEENLIENVRSAFREADVSLTVAGSAAEAEALLLRAPEDVVLFGKTPGDGDLSDFAQQLRKSAGSALLFCCCSYADREKNEGVPEQYGVDGVLHLPFFLSSFAAEVERMRGEKVDVDASDHASVLRGMRFLCAEDNALNAEILGAILDMNGASCVIYPDGKQLADAFVSVKPGDIDAILMDVQMPVMNGLEATKAIRKGENPFGKTVPIIAMTANAFSEDVQNCLRAGMDAHVSKPIDVAVLAKTLKNIKDGKNFWGGGGQLLTLRKNNVDF